MRDAEVIQIVREHFEECFPKVCPKCGRSFATLREYILVTQRCGQVISYDAEMRDWNTPAPVGTLAYANCPCGNTLALATEGMPNSRRGLLLNWVRIETQRRGVSAEALLGSLRDEIRRQVLAEPGQGNA